MLLVLLQHFEIDYRGQVRCSLILRNSLDNVLWIWLIEISNDPMMKILSVQRDNYNARKGKLDTEVAFYYHWQNVGKLQNSMTPKESVFLSDKENSNIRKYTTYI